MKEAIFNLFDKKTNFPIDSLLLERLTLSKLSKIEKKINNFILSLKNKNIDFNDLLEVNDIHELIENSMMIVLLHQEVNIKNYQELISSIDLKTEQLYNLLYQNDDFIKALKNLKENKCGFNSEQILMINEIINFAEEKGSFIEQHLKQEFQEVSLKLTSLRNEFLHYHGNNPNLWSEVSDHHNKNYRKNIYVNYHGFKENLVDNILLQKKLYDKKYQLLNYDNFLNFKLGKRVVKQKELIENLSSIALNNKKSDTFWDKDFNKNILIEKNKINYDKINPFFKKKSIINMIILLGDLFGLCLKKEEKTHKFIDLTFSVYKKDRYLGKIYLDLKERKNKSDGACCLYLKSDQDYFAYINAFNGLGNLYNFKIIAHEIGHAINFFLCEKPFLLHSGSADTEVVEFFSHFCEQMSLTSWFLKQVLEHHETGCFVNDKDLNLIFKENDLFCSSSDEENERSINSLISLIYFSSSVENFDDLKKLEKDFWLKYMPGEYYNTSFLCSLEHEFACSLYTASFYCYVISNRWAEKAVIKCLKQNENFEKIKMFFSNGKTLNNKDLIEWCNQ